MQRRKYLIFVLTSLFSWLITLGCAPGVPLASSGTRGNNNLTITVSAAASLQDALDTITPLFTKTYPNIAVDYNFASSGALQRQIEQGVPADVFFSAATNQMEKLLKKELILFDSRQDLIGNNLVLIAPITSNLAITDITQLKDTGINQVAVGEFRSVPAGQYAKQAFQTLELLDVFQSKFIFGNNVRSVLTAVESGNVELGIVYASDAVLSNQVKVLTTVPKSLHQPIVYPIAVVQNSHHPEAAQLFIDFLTTDSVQAIFADFGFDSI
ncbi:MAG: molybdate ABC transporter substrate-binding protein [Leptolyngbya sp. SIO3F4]|nr:molybdate ABC transporter substrate-binding protein [Leptolyngbya sp. SIO3F4]